MTDFTALENRQALISEISDLTAEAVREAYELGKRDGYVEGLDVATVAAETQTDPEDDLCPCGCGMTTVEVENEIDDYDYEGLLAELFGPEDEMVEVPIEESVQLLVGALDATLDRLEKAEATISALCDENDESYDTIEELTARVESVEELLGVKYTG